MKGEPRETTEHEAVLQGQDWHADVQRDGLPEAPCYAFSEHDTGSVLSRCFQIHAYR